MAAPARNTNTVNALKVLIAILSFLIVTGASWVVQ
jgi:hypothetical protein